MFKWHTACRFVRWLFFLSLHFAAPEILSQLSIAKDTGHLNLNVPSPVAGAVLSVLAKATSMKQRSLDTTSKGIDPSSGITGSPGTTLSKPPPALPWSRARSDDEDEAEEEGDATAWRPAAWQAASRALISLEGYSGLQRSPLHQSYRQHCSH